MTVEVFTEVGCDANRNDLLITRAEDVQFSGKFYSIIDTLQVAAKGRGHSDTLDLNSNSDEGARAYKKLSSRFGLSRNCSSSLLRLLDKNDTGGINYSIDLSAYDKMSETKIPGLAAQVYASLQAEYRENVDEDGESPNEDVKKESRPDSPRITSKWPGYADPCDLAYLSVLLFTKN